MTFLDYVLTQLSELDCFLGTFLRRCRKPLIRPSYVRNNHGFIWYNDDVFHLPLRTQKLRKMLLPFVKNNKLIAASILEKKDLRRIGRRMMLILLDYIRILDQNPDCINDLGIGFGTRIGANVYASVYIADLMLLLKPTNNEVSTDPGIHQNA